MLTTGPLAGSLLPNCEGLSSRAHCMHRVTLLDTAAASTNLGDSIIMEAVRHEIDGLFPDSAVFEVTSHEWMGPHSRRLIRQADWAIAGGTSLLSSRMWFRSNWRVKPDRCAVSSQRRSDGSRLVSVPECARSILSLDAEKPSASNGYPFGSRQLHPEKAHFARHQKSGEYRLSYAWTLDTRPLRAPSQAEGRIRSDHDQQLSQAL